MTPRQGCPSRPLLTVVLVNYNGAHWLGRCLSALSAQTLAHTEIVLVDNGSTDDSVARVRAGFPEVLVVESRYNSGFAGGNNIGVAAASADLVVMMNVDTWVEATFLEELLGGYTASGCDVVAPYETPYEPSAPAIPWSTSIDVFGHPFSAPVTSAAGAGDFYLSGACLLFSKDLYRSTAGLDENFFMYCEEVDWFWRLQLLGKTFTHVNGLFIHHDAGASSPSLLRYDVFLWRNQNTLQMILKNYGVATLVWVLPLYLLQTVVEAVAFLALGRPRIAWTYIEGLRFNIKHRARTRVERRKVQSARVVPDRVVIGSMYHGLAKVSHLRRRLAT